MWFMSCSRDESKNQHVAGRLEVKSTAGDKIHGMDRAIFISNVQDFEDSPYDRCAYLATFPRLPHYYSLLNSRC